jgi:type 1 glutamine amidotransferase
MTRERLTLPVWALGVLVLALSAPLAAQQEPLRIFIRASAKTHSAGQHDYPRFLAEWTKLLSERGAQVQGAQRFPSAEELAGTDVLIDYAADGGNVSPEERAVLDSYLKRGGGIVVMHDGICGDDPQWLAGIIGGAKKHGERNWFAGHTTLKFVDRSHPIVQGQSDFEFDDEMFYLLRVAPEMHVLATAANQTGEQVPQLWTMEKALPGGKPYRSFVSLQGHNHASFSMPEYQAILLRGIAWAGKRPADLLQGKKK